MALRSWLLVLLVVMAATPPCSKASLRSHTLGRRFQLPLNRIIRHSAGNAKVAALPTGTPLMYGGGKVCSGPITINVLFYGSMWQVLRKQASMISSFLTSLSGDSVGGTLKDYWSVVGRYNGTDGPVSNKITVNPQFLSYAYGNSFDAKTTQMVMQQAVNDSIFGWDPTSIYLLLTDPLVSVQYHCAKFCSYKDTFNLNGQTAFFGVVPHAARCPFACGYYPSESTPNYRKGLAGVVNSIAYVLQSLAAQGPYPGDGWTTTTGSLIGSLCARQYVNSTIGVHLPGGTQFKYNVQAADGTFFLIQGVWDPMTSQCISA